MEPTLTTRTEAGREIPLLVWRPAAALLGVSSAPLGGGLGRRHWVVNATVSMSYDRPDPAAHLREIARDLALSGPGVGLLTGVDVAEVVRRADAGVTVWATVGLGDPILAAELGESDDAGPEGAEPAPADRVGTINIVAYVPARLAPAALVNGVATVAEAKAQALRDLGLAATGTATDAVCLLCPPGGPVQPYGGPRSTWGARLARAAYQAVIAGGAAGGVPWSHRRHR